MKKIAVGEKSVVLVLSRAEAKTLAHTLRTGFIYNGVGFNKIRAKLQAAREEIGDAKPAPESEQQL